MLCHCHLIGVVENRGSQRPFAFSCTVWGLARITTYQSCRISTTPSLVVKLILQPPSGQCLTTGREVLVSCCANCNPSQLSDTRSAQGRLESFAAPPQLKWSSLWEFCTILCAFLGFPQSLPYRIIKSTRSKEYASSAPLQENHLRSCCMTFRDWQAPKQTAAGTVECEQEMTSTQRNRKFYSYRI